MLKSFLRNTIGIGGKHLGPLLRRVDSSITIFTLHDVTDDPAPFTQENDIWVSTELFKNQMAFIAENFNVISMDNLLRGDIPRRAAMITFDDGYAGTFTNGLPILSDMRLPCTVFVNMSPMYGENYWAERIYYLCGKVPQFLQFLAEHIGTGVDSPEMQCTQELVDIYEREHGDDYLTQLQSYISPYASIKDLEEADTSPLVTLGNHLYTHYNVKNLVKNDLYDQYQKNSSALSGFIRYLPVFAFPFGHPEICFSTDQAAFLLRSGALRLFTSWPRPNRDHTAKLLDRIVLTTRHIGENRMWFLVLKLPLSDMLGLPGPAWEREFAELNS